MDQPVFVSNWAYKRPFDRDDIEILAQLPPTSYEIFGFDGNIIIYRPPATLKEEA